MHCHYINKKAVLIVILALGLSACSSAEPTLEINEQAIAAVTVNPTVILPTASAATATVTKGPPTETPTRVIHPSSTPIALPSPTSTSEPASPVLIPTPSAQVYIVETYDTLLDIAIRFETTTEALLALNGISENDFLQIGQKLLIPLPGQNINVNEVVAVGDNQTAAVVEASVQATEVAVAAESKSLDAQATTETPSEQSQQPAPTAVAPPTATPAPAIAGGASPPVITRSANINPLTGLPVNDPGTLQRRPLMVRVGNDSVARTSQVGLNSADVVYEEITEWWVTRFTAIFLSKTPSTIAPIRSARLINVQLVPQYQGALAHSGGSDPVRWEISQAPIVNLDEFYNARPYFYRLNEGWQTRLAVDAEAARNYMVDKGSETPVSLHGFQFSNTIAQGEAADNIFVPYPRATSFTQWIYNAGSGKYLRWIDTVPLSDADGSGQIAASNVIIYFAEHQKTDIVEDSNGATAIRIIINGQGPAWFFRDGKLNKGFWQTDGSRTPYFAYKDGSPYLLKPGNTWIEVVPTYYTIGLNDPSEASAVGRN